MAPVASSSSLPNNQVGVDIRQQGQSLVVEFLRSTLPENLRRVST